jgi:uncharacterized protein YciI
MSASPNTQFFFLRLNPPRPTFPGDITEAEQAVMTEHAAYWRGWTEKGKVVVFGPVMDPNGVFGMAVIEAESEEEVRGLIAGDPVTKAGLGSYEVHPMRVGAVRG